MAVAEQCHISGLAEGVDLNCSTARGQTALMLAASSRGQSSLQIISFLLESQTQFQKKQLEQLKTCNWSNKKSQDGQETELSMSDDSDDRP